MDESALNLTIRDQPIFEDESQAKQAMDDMANTLRLVGVRQMILSYFIINLPSVPNKPESDATQEHCEVGATYETLCSFQTQHRPAKTAFLRILRWGLKCLFQPRRSYPQSM